MKKLLKRLLYFVGLGSIRAKVIKKRYEAEFSNAVSVENRGARFQSIYDRNLWGRNTASSSGPGSTLQATEHLRTTLSRLITELEIQVLVDVGCGDFNWMRKLELDCHYIGVDVVKSVIDTNTKNYRNRRREFHVLDAVVDPLPEGDAVLCREVIFHLSFDDGINLLANLKRSNAKYLMATSNQRVEKNVDIRTGNFREINMSKPPYNLGRPIESIKDDGVTAGRCLLVWQLD